MGILQGLGTACLGFERVSALTLGHSTRGLWFELRKGLGLRDRGLGLRLVAQS